MRDHFNAFTQGFEDGMAAIGEWVWGHWPLVLAVFIVAVLFLEGR